MDTLDSLSPDQRETLASFQAITATDNLETSVTVLNNAGWDLEVSLRREEVAVSSDWDGDRVPRPGSCRGITTSSSRCGGTQ